MRIAVVAPSLEILGGQAVQALALVAGLRREGHDVAFVPINAPPPAALRWIRRVPYARTLVNEALYVPSLRRLRGADVVHIFSASYCSFLLAPVPAILVARRLGKRTVLHYHSGEADDHLARWGALVHPWLRRVDEIVVPSEYLRAVFARHGYAPRVVPNVVDTARFGYRARVPLRPCLVSARNLERHYRVDVAIEALALLRLRYPAATLTVAGDGRERPRLERLAAALGGGVRFAGAVTPSRMPELYADADIFVNAAVVDNQPVSVLEAFAAGLPVVSPATGDLAALVRDGETGLVVPPGDPAAVARAVATLVEDPERARGLAERARREVDAYSWPRVRERWAAVYAGGPA